MFIARSATVKLVTAAMRFNTNLMAHEANAKLFAQFVLNSTFRIQMFTHCKVGSRHAERSRNCTVE